MDTLSLRLFVLAADKLNISAAGRTLGLAPAAASTRLAKLETQLGAELLHRSTRKVALSLDGADFLPYAREILAQEDAALAALGNGEASPTGMLRFAAPSSFAQLYIAPLLPAFHDAHPGLRLDLRLSDTPFDLIEGSYDLALRNAPLADTSLKGRKLADDLRILCAAPAYLKKRGRPASPEALAEHQLIGFRDLAPRKLLAGDGRTGSFDPGAAGARLMLDDGMNQKATTLAGAGVSVNSLWSVQEELQSGTLVRILPEYVIEDGAALWLVYPKSNVLTAKVRVFIDFLLERIGKAPPWLDA
jgi:DNA-binding transcriptional LysR family regulator